MLDSSLQIYALIGFIAIVVFVLCWYLLFIMLRVPDDNREYFDDPPLFYKIFGFFINVIAFYLSPFINKNTYDNYEKKIVYAGVEYQFKPEHIIASKIISAFVFTVFVFILLVLAEQKLIFVLLATLFGYIYPDLWLKEAKKKRNNSISKNLPFFLDMITLSVESGLNLNGAIRQAVDKSPHGPVRQEFEKVVRDVKTGVSRADAFRKMSLRIDDQSIKSLVSSIIQAEKMGMNLGPILRSQADQRRIERFQKAEKMAMEAPVKLLFPLVAFIFPGTFIVIGFPVYVMIKDAFL
ncbi:type II secretion system F family protein [Psychrobacter sp. K31L]|uniref:type II secretion system F family protein n=1 Tax=Psychrobacter sp. K31L TaxID=2820758 RepID=UPI001B32C7E8|nr:type II secretion system F family protein [Psychrobacter sp. K31L]MBP3946755.1 type II secretion system F family protein [Psychrobacter sp. K31L]